MSIFQTWDLSSRRPFRGTSDLRGHSWPSAMDLEWPARGYLIGAGLISDSDSVDQSCRAAALPIASRGCVSHMGSPTMLSVCPIGSA